MLRVYLDELGEPASQSFGMGIVQLVVEDEQIAQQQGKQLIQKARQELEDEGFKRKVLELIETILVYKFTELSREEIEAMFGLDELKQTRYFREVAEEAKKEGKLEGKLESIPGLLKIGLNVQQIAVTLGLDIELVRQAAQQTSAIDTPQSGDTEA